MADAPQTQNQGPHHQKMWVKSHLRYFGLTAIAVLVFSGPWQHGWSDIGVIQWPVFKSETAATAIASGTMENSDS